MENKLGVEEELDYILLPDRIESDLEDDDEWEDEMIKVDGNLDQDYNPNLDINVAPLEIVVNNLIGYEEDQDCIDQGDQTINQQQKNINERKRHIFSRRFLQR